MNTRFIKPFCLHRGTARRFPFALPVALTLLLGLAGGCQQYTSRPYAFLHGEALGTFYAITVDLDTSKALLQAIDSTLDQINARFSIYDSSSLICQFNLAQEYIVDNEFAKLTSLALRVAAASNGAFDPTVGPYARAWGFAQTDYAADDTLLLESMRDYVGYNHLRVAGDTIFKNHPKVELSFNAIAKGYASDCVLATLRRRGAVNAMVEIGGEVALLGRNPHGQPWRIGIDAPVPGLAPGEKLLRTLADTAGGIATSGNYRNFHIEGKKHWGHTIDPRNGHPAQSTMRSATILAPTCAEADAWATACMVMPPEEAKATIAQQTDLKAFLVYQRSPIDTTLITWNSKNLQ